MGHTRVIYTDATTAEAASALKGNGFLEDSKGGLFTSHTSPVKVYVVWGRSSYFPEIVARLDFPPRIQIHLKCRDAAPDLELLALETAQALRSLCGATRVRIFNTDQAVEIPC